MLWSYNNSFSNFDFSKSIDNGLILSSSFLGQVGSLMDTISIVRLSGRFNTISFVFNNTTNVATFCKIPFIYIIGGDDDVLLEPCNEGDTTNPMRPQSTKEHISICTQVSFLYGVGKPFSVL